jgi:3-hydroxyisobutyrate dehydrogenase
VKKKEHGMKKKKQKIAWIGTGVMGSSMCGHVLDAGYPVTVYTRTKKKAGPLLDKGAKWADDAAGASADADIVFSIVGYPVDVQEVYLSSCGVFESMPSGGVVCDMTTSSPGLAKRIHKEAKNRDIGALDAPVSGGDVGARQGTLSIMVGGEREMFQRVLPFFKLMGKNINYMGGPGAGQHTKMANQIHIASTMISAVESLLYAHRAGLDLEEVIRAIGSGAAGSWTINNLGPRMVKRNFDPGFFIDHFVKDMGIALEEAKNMKLALPGLALAHQFYVSAQALGFGKFGTHALYKVFEKMNGMEKK